MQYGKFITSVTGIALVQALAWGPAAWAEDVYRFEDDQGTVHYVDTLDKVPAAYRDQVSTLTDNSLPVVSTVTKEKASLGDVAGGLWAQEAGGGGNSPFVTVMWTVGALMGGAILFLVVMRFYTRSQRAVSRGRGVF